MADEPPALPPEAARDEDGRDEDGRDEDGRDEDDVDAPPSSGGRRAAPKLRWPVLLLAAAVVACLGIWQQAPSERQVRVRVAASARVRQLELTWLDGDGSTLKHSRHHFDGTAVERSVSSRVVAGDGVYRLEVRVRNAGGQQAREHRIDLDDGEDITVFAP